MTVETHAAVPLWLLYEEEVDAWRKVQGAQAAAWLGAQNFKGEKHRRGVDSGCGRRARHGRRRTG